MMTPQSYYEMAADLAETAPAQGRLLRFLLLQEQPQEAEEICGELKMTDSTFRRLVNKLRDMGVEIVCTRTHDEDDSNANVRYVYSVRTSEVEDWSTDRRKAVLTAWGRTTKVFERHLHALNIPQPEIYKIVGVMEYVTQTLESINLSVSIRAEEAAKERAAEEAIQTEETVTV